MGTALFALFNQAHAELIINGATNCQRQQLHHQQYLFTNTNFRSLLLRTCVLRQLHLGCLNLRLMIVIQNPNA